MSARQQRRRAHLRLGSRASPLALAQARAVARALARAHRRSGLKVELVEIATHGDRDRRSALRCLGGRGVFVKELENALLAGRIDLAVHSLKDMPIRLPRSLRLAALSAREDPRDVIVTRAGTRLEQLCRGALVGSSSPRRRAQLALLYPHLRFAEIRGNVETRLSKVARGRYAATILACAGLKRLGWRVRRNGILVAPASVAPASVAPASCRLSRRHPAGLVLRFQLLPLSQMLPAPGQGALALECRARDALTRRLAQAIHCPESAACVRAERACLAALGGGCHLPLGAYADLARKTGEMRLRAVLALPDGSLAARADVRGRATQAEALGRRAARVILRSPAGRKTLAELQHPRGES
jgi:hydroxymethylbilane synthase